MMDLIVFYSPDKCTMTYYINNEQAGYKIEYPFAYIKNICLENNEGDPSKPAGIVIELNHPPHFFMDSSANAQQASGPRSQPPVRPCGPRHPARTPRPLGRRHCDPAATA